MFQYNLPPQPTPFVGRTHELAEFDRLLANPTCRLLTLVGPGGIGKTRLALQAAQNIADNGVVETRHGAPLHPFPNGIYFVSLQSLSSPHHILSAIAEAVSFQFHQGGEPRQELLDYLHEKSLLLILDNFEHLLDGAQTIADILNHAPGVKIVVTSRETLNLQEEWRYLVQGMSFPEDEPTVEIESYSAVRLFTQSAQRVRPDFSLVSERESVIRICKLVEGLPLALEMTAAWLKRLPCQEIVGEITRGLDILETPARNAPLRHRSIRVVFAHSWDLLTDPERDVFKKLSVFRAGFRKEAAQAVAGASLAVLSALVDKSLVRVDDSGRYDLHYLMRQYGEERLSDSLQESEWVRDLHCAYFAEFMQKREADIKGLRQLAALDEIEADFENIRAAWLWALRQKNYDAIDHALESQFLFCEIRGRFLEGQELFWQAQTQLTAEPGDEWRPVWARIVPRSIWLRGLHSNVADQREALKKQVEDSLTMSQLHGDRAQAAFCLWLLGAHSHFTQQQDSAIIFLEQSQALFSELDDRFYAARAADWLGAAYGLNGQQDRCIQLSQQSLVLRRAIGDQFGAAASLLNLVAVALDTGHYIEAERYTEEMGAIYRKIGSRVWTARCNAFLALIALQTGDFRKAQVLAEEVLEIVTNVDTSAAEGGALALSVLGLLAALKEDNVKCWQLCERAVHGLGPHEPLAEHGLAIAACGLEDYRTAKHYLLRALKADVTLHHMLGMSYILIVAAHLLTHEGKTEQAVELLGLAFRQPVSAKRWLQELPFLTQLRAQLQMELGATAYTTTWALGEASNLEAVGAALLEQFQNAEQEPRQVADAANNSPAQLLSQRELDVLHLIDLGLTNDEIAERLIVTVATVKKHINHIFAKLGVKNRMQAVVRGEDLNLL